MSRYEQVSNDLWNDSPFCALTAAAKLVYFWTFTNPACGMSGLYKVRREVVALDTGLSPEAVADALAELDAAGMVRFEAGVLWCCARAKHLTSRNPRVAKSVARDVAALAPTHPFRVAFLERYGTFAWLRDELRPLVVKTVTEPSPDGHGTVTAFPSTTGNPETVSGPSDDGPMPEPMSDAVGSTDTSRRVREDEDAVWSHYLATFYAERRGGPLPTFDERRRGIVRAALKVRDVEHCKLAVTGLSRSPHHRGENEQGVAYTDIRYALRGNGQRGESHEERIDRMAALATAGPPRRPGARPNLSAAALMGAPEETS